MARGQRNQQGDQQQDPTDWVTRTADLALRHAESVNGGTLPDLVTCASGISPSGPIHLGNLREFLTVHFVAEEIRRRGINVRHLHSWDDYDRFRKVPAGVDPSWSEHIGRPLSAVPDPTGEFTSWAERYKAPLRAALAEMGCDMVEVNQTEMYTSGAYREQVLTAIRKRGEIESVMARFRTKKTDDAPADDEGSTEGDLARFPYKPYCRGCGRDTVTLTSYDDETTDLAYTCDACGDSYVTNVATQNEGKLVWKVDWPMRWTYEGVHFEPGGVDHASPGSSYTVGKELVGPIFGGTAPSFVGYSFVGVAGMPKMSSSKGGVPTAAEALRILEAPILRWLYVRRQPKQAFNVDFGQEVLRLYDEWDALTKKAAIPEKRDAAVLAWERASATSTAGTLPTPAVVVPFRMLSSVADVTAGSREITARTVGATEADLEPRLDKAATWITSYVDPEERTTVREDADTARLAALDDDEARWLGLLLDGLPASFADADEMTTLIYGVPKVARGLAVDDAPTDEVKTDQKAFFKLLYHLLVDAERGPRLPTLFAALGPDKVRTLLTPPA
ncbi:lysine--tRNA ligase [Pimelobacter simplex]|uniref:Lysine--tRNA ligase n=1 Tax=Nocardioides simplex TaxID=2045 RepID=A0A0A1DUA0_NOCSI|nr:lysine--tRNA ligase [Pimelobacter simplex]AIY20143.2 Lysyl-tRNA synthetase (class I) [Pimelobacter simplex]MCG8148989.1 lysine--tRNA ligase [Pimelobacter simplex]GEB14797.1 lysine--tRNA ligase [Pimelobacter simplex]SFM25175.1 lysyl-tRNA synthetase, class I [Pimelobacter simplex]